MVVQDLVTDNNKAVITTKHIQTTIKKKQRDLKVELRNLATKDLRAQEGIRTLAN